LNEVSFEIGAGQMIGVVGPTGSGKSTIVSLIPRFYDPNAGRVTIDGHDLRDLTVSGLRSQIAYVLQETVLFRGSVADNIAYGKGTATLDEIVAAAKLANADGFISQMPQDTTRWSEIAAIRFRADSGSASESRERSSATIRF